MNYYDKLTGRKEHGQVQSTGAPEQVDAPVSLTHTFQEDDCCGKRIAHFLRSDMTAASWVCPKCGCEWRPEGNGTIIHWTPVVIVGVL